MWVATITFRLSEECWPSAAMRLRSPRRSRNQFFRDRPIRAGISFLREQDPTPELLPAGVTVDEAWLASQARALVTAQIDGRWQVLPETKCRALGCGYVYRCHPSGGRL